MNGNIDRFHHTEDHGEHEMYFYEPCYDKKKIGNVCIIYANPILRIYPKRNNTPIEVPIL